MPEPMNPSEDKRQIKSLRPYALLWGLTIIGLSGALIGLLRAG
ncbi:MAG: hypothetical protein QM645_06220 [Asticcacaulis sp.]